MRFISPIKILFTLVFLLAFVLRTVNLHSIPAGLHQDEAWFAYNGFLLLDQGSNIYQDRWPLTVDMWGDHVSAAHSYFAAIFIQLFGLSVASFRFTTVFFSLATLAVTAGFLYRVTKKWPIVLIFATLFALSPWNIIMARASSTVIIDGFFLLCFIWVLYEALNFGFTQMGKSGWFAKYLGFLAGVYVLSLVCYFTYFTSRLLIIPVGVSLILMMALLFKSWQKKVILPAAGMLVVFLVFPFLVMLNTPYAQGRFKETTIIQNDVVKASTFEDISNSGLAGLPPLPTRILYNKVTENFQFLLEQYVSFFSPNVMLAELDKPVRYFVNNTAAVTYLEYIGLLMGFGLLLHVAVFRKQPREYLLLAFLVVALLLAAVPSALTIDDFPNFQRAVIMTPFWQMIVAVAMYLFVIQFNWFQKWTEHRQAWTSVAVVLLLSSISILPFLVSYFVVTPYIRPYYRSTADMELADWINMHVQDKPILVAGSDYTYIYPYLQGAENFLEQEVVKVPDQKYFIKANELNIGNRVFVHNTEVCKGNMLEEKILNQDPDFIAIKTFDNYEYKLCVLPKNYELVEMIEYSDGTKAYDVFEKTSPMTPELQEYLEASISARLQSRGSN